MRSRALALAFVAVFVASVAEPAGAVVYMSRQEAIASAFPDAERVEKRTLVIDDAQARAIEDRARSRLTTRLVTVHTGYRGDAVLGHAFIDVHTVRTLPEAFMVVLTPEGAVRSLRMLAFHEPEEYRPPDRWLAQFEKQRLGPELRLRGRIHGISGSTMSSRAVTEGVRRALALWEVVLSPAPASLVGTPSSGAAPSPGH